MPFPAAEIDAKMQFGVQAAKSIANGIIVGVKPDVDQFTYLSEYIKAILSWSGGTSQDRQINATVADEPAMFAKQLEGRAIYIKAVGGTLNRIETTDPAGAQKITAQIKEYAEYLSGLEAGLLKHYRAKFNPTVQPKPDELFPGVVGGATDQEILKLLKEIHKALGLS